MLFVSKDDNLIVLNKLIKGVTSNAANYIAGWNLQMFLKFLKCADQDVLLSGHLLSALGLSELQIIGFRF